MFVEDTNYFAGKPVCSLVVYIVIIDNNIDTTSRCGANNIKFFIASVVWGNEEWFWGCFGHGQL